MTRTNQVPPRLTKRTCPENRQSHTDSISPVTDLDSARALPFYRDASNRELDRTTSAAYFVAMRRIAAGEQVWQVEEARGPWEPFEA
jgi:hypothetical protein